MSTVSVELLRWDVAEITRATETFLSNLVELSEEKGIELFPGIDFFLPRVVNTLQNQRLEEHQMGTDGLIVGFSSYPRASDRSLILPMWKPHLILSESLTEGFNPSDIPNVRWVTTNAVDLRDERDFEVSNNGTSIVMDYSTERFAKTIGYIELPLL